MKRLIVTLSVLAAIGAAIAIALRLVDRAFSFVDDVEEDDDEVALEP